MSTKVYVLRCLSYNPSGECGCPSESIRGVYSSPELAMEAAGKDVYHEWKRTYEGWERETSWHSDEIEQFIVDA